MSRPIIVRAPDDKVTRKCTLINGEKSTEIEWKLGQSIPVDFSDEGHIQVTIPGIPFLEDGFSLIELSGNSRDRNRGILRSTN